MRRVSIACCLQSKFVNNRANEALAAQAESTAEGLDLLNQAGEMKPDIAVLSETFCDGVREHLPETIDGPAVTGARAMAKKHSMNVIAPIILKCDSGRNYNVGVVIDRNGEIVGTHHKCMPFYGEPDVVPGGDPEVYELDFGVIGVAICFESQFPDTWMRLGELGAEIVFWPSAYSGGRKLIAPAIYNNYYVVSCTIIPPDSTVIDINGDQIMRASGPHQVVKHVIDLDRTMVHDNFNGAKLAKIRLAYDGRIRMTYLDREGWWLIESLDPEVSVKAVLKEHEVETLRDYVLRSRKVMDECRRSQTPVPTE